MARHVDPTYLKQVNAYRVQQFIDSHPGLADALKVRDKVGVIADAQHELSLWGELTEKHVANVIRIASSVAAPERRRS